MEGKRHSCHQCRPHDGEGPYSQNGVGEGPELGTIDTTFPDDGGEIYFTSGYSAREIAEKHAAATQGKVFVNTVGRRVKRSDLTVPVAYAVAKSPIYTLKAPDDFHPGVYRCYWRPLS